MKKKKGKRIIRVTSQGADWLPPGHPVISEGELKRIPEKAREIITRGGKGPQTRVHAFRRVILCRGIDCDIEFVPKRRDQVFCSGICRARYFEVARFLGTRILEESRHDPELSAIIDRLLPGQNLSLPGEERRRSDGKGTA